MHPIPLLTHFCINQKIPHTCEHREFYLSPILIFQSYILRHNEACNWVQNLDSDKPTVLLELVTRFRFWVQGYIQEGGKIILEVQEVLNCWFSFPPNWRWTETQSHIHPNYLLFFFWGTIKWRRVASQNIKIGGVRNQTGSFVNKPEMKWLMCNSSQVNQPKLPLHTASPPSSALLKMSELLFHRLPPKKKNLILRK